MATISLSPEHMRQSSQTQFFYSKEVQAEIGSLLREQGANRVLILYGADIFRTAHWYKQARCSLLDAGLHVFELGNIEYQAEVNQIESGIALCKQLQVDYILAVGGGSVIDAAKAIAVGAMCDHCIWEYFAADKKPGRALPISVLLTIPGSGSENNDRTILTNRDTLLRMSCQSAIQQPRHCFVNPEIFYTISQEQLAQSVVMMLYPMISKYFLLAEHDAAERELHKLEQRIRLLMRKACLLQQNRFDDAAWLALIFLDCHKDNLMEEWREDSCQRMADELSAMYEISYGAVLAVLIPAWMRFICENHKKAFTIFASQVMAVEEEDTKIQREKGIIAVEQFFTEMHLPLTLCQLGIEDFCFKNAAQICTGYGWGKEKAFGSLQLLYWQDIYQIYQSVYQRSEILASLA